MKLSSTFWLLCAATLVCFPITALAQGKPGTKSQDKARVVNITGNDAMKYNVTTIEAHPGESLRIVLKNVGSMPKIAMAHNVVILKPGTDGAAFVTAGIASRETEFIAPSAKADILAATALAGAGETVEVTFKVPAKPATYPFVCTFPGHYSVGMHGTIVAK